MNSAALNKEGDVNQLKVEKERINAEKGGLDMILKQKTSEIENLTKSYEEMANKANSLTQERNNYKIKLDDLEADKATQELGKSRMRNQGLGLQNSTSLECAFFIRNLSKFMFFSFSTQLSKCLTRGQRKNDF